MRYTHVPDLTYPYDLPRNLDTVLFRLSPRETSLPNPPGVSAAVVSGFSDFFFRNPFDTFYTHSAWRSVRHLCPPYPDHATPSVNPTIPSYVLDGWRRGVKWGYCTITVAAAARFVVYCRDLFFNFFFGFCFTFQTVHANTRCILIAVLNTIHH